MKKLILLPILVCFFLSQKGFAQIIWEQVSLPVPDATVISMNADNNGTIIIGLQADVYYSPDYDSNWYQCSNWPNYTPKCIGFNSSHHIFVGTTLNGILRSTDGGISFTEINNGLTNMNIWTIVILENDDILLGTPGGIYRSVNNGDTWALYGTGLPNDEIKVLTYAGNGKVFAGSSDNGIYKSDDHGATWTETNNGLPDTTEVTALLAVNGSTLVYAGLFPQGSYSSADYGNTWMEDNEGLPFPKSSSSHSGITITNIQQLALLMVILTIYEHGVYVGNLPGKDYATQWIQVNEGLPDDPPVTCLTINPDHDVFLGAVDQGLFKNMFPVKVPQIDKAIDGYSVMNIPNPFTVSTDFVFIVPVTSNVKLTLYNLMGDELITLADRVFQKGRHQVTWNPAGIAPGIYFYTLGSDAITISGKLLVTK